MEDHLWKSRSGAYNFIIRRHWIFNGTEREVVIYHFKKINPLTARLKNLKITYERHYGVVYQSRQSYDDLLKAARLSWHRTQAVNPKHDEAQVC